MQVKKQQLELDMEQQTGSKSGKEYIRVAYCHPAYLTSMQSTSCEMLGWVKHKLESRLPGEVSNHDGEVRMSQTEKDQKSEAARKGSKRTCCGMARGPISFRISHSLL